MTISYAGHSYQVSVDHVKDIKDNSVYPIDTEIVNFITKTIKSLEDKKQKIFVHCSAGVGRSGVLAAIIYLGLNHKYLSNKTNFELAEFIFRMWDNFNRMRPGTIGNKRQLFNVIELFFSLRL